MSGDISSLRNSTRTLPDEVRCIAWKKSCSCGYHFRRTDLYDGKAKNTRKKGPPPPCPKCGRERERCLKARMRGCSVCRSHGGRGIVKRAYIPTHITLDDEGVAAFEKLMEEDDQSLKKEFHVLRIFFGKAMKQFQDAFASLETDSPADAIGELLRLTAIVDRASRIAQRRAKIHQIAPQGEQVTRVEFADPRMKYPMKEALRKMEIDTIKRMLVVLLQSFDPTGELQLIEKVPASLRPYLPLSAAVTQEEPPKAE